jgi:NAD(P)-dependent dehydrogenase (short-subunit alcohol dehydrogenase family)
MLRDLKDKGVLVTGASTGIGAALAKGFAAEGAKVALHYNSSETCARDVAAAIEKAGGSVVLVKGDLGREGEAKRVVDEAAKALGRLDILVNNAGLALRDRAVDLTLEAWSKVVAVNLTGAFLMARAAARAMIAGGRGGSIVNTSSIMGLSGGGLYPNVSYQATKGAIVNMTRALAVEWAEHGIRVNAVAPTYVRTPFIAPLLAQPELVARIEAMTPLRRLAEPEEVAAAILFLAGPASAMITGHTLPIDGGFLAQ